MLGPGLESETPVTSLTGCPPPTPNHPLVDSSFDPQAYQKEGEQVIGVDTAENVLAQVAMWLAQMLQGADMNHKVSQFPPTLGNQNSPEMILVLSLRSSPLWLY